MVVSLLRLIYDDTADRCLLNEREWDECLEACSRFDISPQIQSLLKRHGKWEGLPADVRKRLASSSGQVYSQNWFLKRQESELLQWFEQDGLAVIPLKGTRFAEKYFGHFAARMTGDIDLLVRGSDLDRAVALLETHGCRFQKKIHNHAALTGPNGFPLIELHWTLDKAGWSDLQVEPIWQRARRSAEDSCVMELSIPDSFYFMCLHAVRHRVDSPRYILDIAQMIHESAAEIDYGDLLKRANADRTYNRVRTALSIAYGTLPHLHAIKPLPFPPRRTAWSYPAICDASKRERTIRYYVYRLYFKYMIFDTWKHRMFAQRGSRARGRAEVAP